MKTYDRSDHVKNRDIAAVLDSLDELFRESKDSVTPKQVTMRTEQKLRRPINLHEVAYVCSSLGFVTRRSGGKINGYCFIPNPELLTEKRAQFCAVDASDKNKESEDMKRQPTVVERINPA